MDNNNLITAVILSVLIFIGFQYLYVKPQQEHYHQQVLAQQLAKQATPASAPVAVSTLRDRDVVIKDSPRIAIATPELHGSFNLKGARLDDLSLAQYHETVDAGSPDIVLLSPTGSHAAYYTEFSWLSDAGVPVPTDETLWTADGKTLSPDHPITLTWNNGHGLIFERKITVDDQFMFTLTDHVTNKGGASVTLYPFGLVARQGIPTGPTSSVIHEGPVGVLGGTLQEYKYKKLMDNGKKVEESRGGWLGITDKYWLVAMAPSQNEKITTEVAYNGADLKDPSTGFFQADFRGAPVTLEVGASTEHSSHLFVGAKRVRLLDHYASQYGIPDFYRAIDFGWFYFLTKPFLYLLDFMGSSFGSYGIAILLFTVLLKLATLPLSLKSYHSMSKMKALQPEMKRIQERFAEDKMRQQQEIMELYKREKVNPMSGCLPTLIQIPIFFALYKVLYIGIELRQTPFYGWIKDMSSPDPTVWVNFFGLAPWGVPHQIAVDMGLFTLYLPPALHIGVWPVLMGLSMFLQQKLSPQPPDKSQARMFMILPVVFTYMLSSMPSGLVIYWTWSNLLSITQQWFIMRQDAKKKLV